MHQQTLSTGGHKSEPSSISQLALLTENQLGTYLRPVYLAGSYQDYQAVLWARAESHKALTPSFVEIATLLNLPEKDAQDQTLIANAMIDNLAA